MKRRLFLAGLGVALIAANPALAASFEQAVVRQLKEQGYGHVVVEHTLLGRVRIVAQSSAGMREIVLNPRTGEILRDVLTAADGAVVPVIGRPGGADTGSGGKTGTQGDDDGAQEGNNSGSGDPGKEDSGSENSGKDGSSSGDGGGSEAESRDGDSGDEPDQGD